MIRKLFLLLFWCTAIPLVARTSTCLADTVPTFFFPEAQVRHRSIPEVKFIYSDPCSPRNQVAPGLPWENVNDPEPILPDGVSIEQAPSLPEFAQLSEFQYNAAVSVAFEGMKLIYGPMPEEDYEKFEAIWLPLFDHPDQDIVEYLNALNPLIAQFLGAREAYMRRLTSVQIILLDAATAVEVGDKDAWDLIMAEGVMHTRSLKVLEDAMKAIADRITALGNPPDPLAARCEASRKYRRMLPTMESGPIGQCWTGQRQSDVQAVSLETLYEPVFRHVVPVMGNYQIIELCEQGPVEGLETDYDWLRYIDVRQIREPYDPRVGMEGEEGAYKKVLYPRIPEFPNTGYIKYLLLSEQAGVSEDDPEYEEQRVYGNTVRTYLSRKQTAGYFYKRAMLWSYQNRWAKYETDQNGLLPQDALDDFLEEMRDEMRAYLDAEGLKRKERKERKEELERQNNLDTTKGIAHQLSQTDSVELANIQRKEKIETRQEIVRSIQEQIDRERDILSGLYQRMSTAQGEARAGLAREVDDVKRRIMGFQSTMQSELDNIRFLETGDRQRTRQVFDDYARNKFIHDMKRDAARRDATGRINDRIFRQLKLLPPEIRGKARDYILEALDGEAVATGDLEKAMKVRNTLNEMIVGYAGQEGAEAELAAIDAEANEYYTKLAIGAAGGVVMGLAGAELAAVYGADAAVTIYGTKLVGVAYGGITGMVAGGPAEAVKQSLSYYSPWTAAGVSFFEGYQEAAKKTGATGEDKIWGGLAKAGPELLLEGAFSLGVKGVTHVAYLRYGPESRLFKPIIQTSKQRALNSLRAFRDNNRRQEAGSIIETFDDMTGRLWKLETDPQFNAGQIKDLRAELKQLSASMNADYHVKWHMKYKAKPILRNNFDKQVQSNYSEMIPKMVADLQGKGYVMDGIEFRQFRNADAGGTSSMDLDLAPVNSTTGKEPGSILARFKYVQINGKKVKVTTSDLNEISIQDFMQDAQFSMNSTYKDMFGISAPMSDMNLVTSAHPEAYATTKLLDKDVDWSSITPEELASVGSVINEKMTAIDKNRTMTTVAKFQAKVRESHKELKNMLIPKLEADLKAAKAGSPEQKLALEKLDYWTKMNIYFKRIGTQETNAVEILNLEKKVELQTGGKSTVQVIDDLMMCFGYDPLKTRALANN